MESNQQILPNILVTGTPGTGKTTFSKLLADQINNQLQQFNLKMTHVELSKLINENKLYSDYDQQNQCSIFDEDKVLDFLEPHVPQGGYIVDFHSSEFFPERYFNLVIVLTTNNTILYDRLKSRGYDEKKIQNNVECEIFQECKNEAIQSYKKEIIILLQNNTEQDMNKNINKIFDEMQNRQFFSHLKNN